MLKEVIWESERATESGGLCLTAKAVPMKRSRPASAQVASASLRLIGQDVPAGESQRRLASSIGNGFTRLDSSTKCLSSP